VIFLSKDKEFAEKAIQKRSEREFRKNLLNLLVEIRDLLKELVSKEK